MEQFGIAERSQKRVNSVETKGQRGEVQTLEDMGPALGFGKEVWVLILWTCSVTLRYHNLLFGDSERESLIGRKKQGRLQKT